MSHPTFRDTGPIEQCIVVFPRTSVWIKHEGSRRFLADPTVTTIYNRAQRYERFHESPEGDRCDWFGVSDQVARDIVSQFDSAASESPRPFRFEWAPVSAALYLRQRMLARRARRNAFEPGECEEEVMHLVGDVMAHAYARATHRLSRRPTAAARRRELVEETRTLLMHTKRENLSVHDLARQVSTSPYHLCRVFRSCTGMTLHEYRTDLRVRAALEMVEPTAHGSRTLSAIAHDLGFSSHSHFVRAMRRHLAVTPGGAARLLAGVGSER